VACNVEVLDNLFGALATFVTVSAERGNNRWRCVQSNADGRRSDEANSAWHDAVDWSVVHYWACCWMSVQYMGKMRTVSNFVSASNRDYPAKNCLVSSE